MRRVSCPALAPVCNVFYLCVVEYKFLAPVEKKSGAGVRRGKERYRWTMKALGPCSQSCGGGQQTQVAECVRGGRVVADTKCAGPRPSSRTVGCGRRPCPPAWQPGDWGACSASCGPGLEIRGPSVCRQQLSQSVSIPVSPSLCPSSAPLAGLTERWCEVAPCHHSHVMATQPVSQPPGGHQPLENFSTDWVVQPWGPCSVTCGAGVRERKVHCAAQDSRGGLLPDSQCSHLTRPASEQFCELPCQAENVWLVGAWGHCSAACGHGKQHRALTCLGRCQEETKPMASQDCQAEEKCGAEWVTGRWSVCSHSCGPGMQARTVHCVLTDPDTAHTRLGRAEDCAGNNKRKPKGVRRCHLQHCGPQYFTTQWSSCSEQCGREGFRTRTVVCLSNDQPSSLCREAPDRTETCRVNTCHPSNDYPGEGEDTRDEEEEEEEEDEEDEDYNEIDDLPHTETDTKVLKTSEYQESKSEMSNEILQLPEKHLKFREKSEVCRDKFKNCNVVVQSRLCRYSFYQSNCCSSCAKLHNQ